jgi:hypothetical protein
MAKAIGREEPFSGEAIRLYEKDANEPGSDATRALALVFERPESFIQFGVMPAAAATAREPAAKYDLSDEALEVARGFDQLNAECREHVFRQVQLLRGANPGNGGRRKAAEQDVEIKGGKLQSTSGRKIKKTLR